MKKLITWLMLLCLVLPAYAEEAIKIADVQPDKQYTVELEQTVHLYPPKEKGKRYYTTAQGCATDGTYGYFVTLYKTVNKGAIWKVQLSDWSVVNTAYGLPIDHGNDAAYNSKKHQLVVVNNSPNYDTLTIVNPDTLEIIEQIKPGFESYAISYNAARDQFLIGISGSFDSYTIILRASMKPVLMPFAFMVKQMIVDERSSPFEMMIALLRSDSSPTAHTAYASLSRSSQISFTRATACSMIIGVCSRSSLARLTWRSRS